MMSSAQGEVVHRSVVAVLAQVQHVDVIGDLDRFLDVLVDVIVNFSSFSFAISSYTKSTVSASGRPRLEACLGGAVGARSRPPLLAKARRRSDMAPNLGACTLERPAQARSRANVSAELGFSTSSSAL
jgi:hypothetical protein